MLTTTSCPVTINGVTINGVTITGVAATGVTSNSATATGVTSNGVAADSAAVAGHHPPRRDGVPSVEALGLLAALHRDFEPRRRRLLREREERRDAGPGGARDTADPQTRWIREEDCWRVPSPPPALAGDPAAAVVPREWHLEDAELSVRGEPVAGALVDFVLPVVAEAGRQPGRGPYFCLPGLECHREARLWHDVFVWTEELLGLRGGTIRALVRVDTVAAAAEVEEILWELGEHAAGVVVAGGPRGAPTDQLVRACRRRRALVVEQSVSGEQPPAVRAVPAYEEPVPEESVAGPPVAGGEQPAARAVPAYEPSVAGPSTTGRAEPRASGAAPPAAAA